MPYFDRNAVIDAIIENKIIVIMRGLVKDELLKTVEAVEKGGIRLAEVTFDRSGRTPDSETAENIALLSKTFAGRVHIGAGTVCSAEQVRLAYAAGAGFIISPDTCEEVIRETRRLGLVSIPGAFTPSECTAASRFGADFIKLFPVSEMTPGYVKALKAPLSDLRFLAVGGVTPENAADYIAAGACGIGVSGGIANAKEIHLSQYDNICERAKAFRKAAGL